TRGGGGGGPRVRPGSATEAAGPAAARRACRPASNAVSSSCAAARSSDRRASPTACGMAASTVYRVLRRLGLHRLAWMDRPTGQVIRRYEHERPGDQVHMDIKKLGRILD